MHAHSTTHPITHSITLFHNMPRSGGTLVSKCLASMSGHVLLSEIHPDAQHAASFNAVRQAQNWYGLLKSESPNTTPMLAALGRLAEECHQRQRRLIVRDWAHVDYLGPPVTSSPSMRAALHPLLQDTFSLKHLRLIRHPIDTWMSFRRLSLAKQHEISLPIFMRAYRLYLQQVPSDYDLYYERFLDAPASELSASSRACDLNYNEEFINRWFHYRNITGDTSNSGSLRRIRDIKPRPRREVPPDVLRQAQDNDDCGWIVTTFYDGAW